MEQPLQPRSLWQAVLFAFGVGRCDDRSYESWYGWRRCERAEGHTGWHYNNQDRLPRPHAWLYKGSSDDAVSYDDLVRADPRTRGKG